MRTFDNWIGLLLRMPPESCAMCGVCMPSLVVEADGDLMDGINSYVDAESAVAEGEKREIITALEAFVLMEQK